MGGVVMTDDELRDYVRRARNLVSDVGPLHAQWETIMDAEALLAGKPSVLSRSAVERLLREWLDGLHS